MKSIRITTLALLCLTLLATTFAEARTHESFNTGWSFARFGAMPDGNEKAEPAGLEKTTVDDTNWRKLNLPHDWAIEGPFRDDLPNRTGKLPYAGIGWYRKTFSVPAEQAGQRFFIDFDGAMSHTKVWLNGQYVGEWPFGYASFQLELTKYMKPGEKNVLAVRLDNPPNSSRWYPGAGIYRNVWLTTTGPIHVAHWGTFVTTPEVTDKKATVKIETTAINESDAAASLTIRHTLYEATATPTKVTEVNLEAKSLAAGETSITTGTLEVPNPKLWGPGHPNLYYIETTLLDGEKVLDTYKTTFGIRTIEYKPEGFFLNGKKTQMQGVCMHHDLGPLGSAVSRRAIERQIEILMGMGCNAIRTSHNPPAPELVELCDRMGMLLQVEAFDCWKKGKTTNDYASLFPQWHKKDLEAMVRHYRNSPAVVMWSTGNEVREQGNPAGHAISLNLSNIIRNLDPTRPVSVGCNNQKAGINGFQKTIDVMGYNYKPHMYAQVRKTTPKLPLYGSETASTVSSRGEYFFPVETNKAKGQGGLFQVSSYDLYAPPWASRPEVEWIDQDKNPYVFGEFVWTGFDYIGEPTPYNKDSTNLLNFSDPKERKKAEAELAKLGNKVPSRSSYFGIIDLCGFPKDRYYLYQSRWRPELPLVHILPHWNWPERIGQVTPVHVYTSGDTVELFLNGKSLGRKTKEKFQYRLQWDNVKYAPGELKAVAYKDRKEWATEVVKTTGEATKLELTADRDAIKADGSDLAFITLQISDKDGVLVPRSKNLVTFSLEGPGEIIATGSGDATSHESFQGKERKAFNGLALVVVRGKKGEPGTLRITATSEGLEKGSVEIKNQ